MATNNFKKPSKRFNCIKVVSMYELDAQSILATHVAIISRKLENLGVNSPKNPSLLIEENIFGPFSDPNAAEIESLYAINNRTNKSFSNTYNSGWRDHPNFNWSIIKILLIIGTLTSQIK
ncbi:hypothetical protein MA16_Dca026844 [Dendrobium catenatum]|uniref:Uncharacterized protein n=1 Tax=Dendrobium catenatum TaxID=906689 RepID=A0A2I0XAY3_9ASPA|nr:hypothetical protein MA16_Dca026844 [Dendrobium catenatum]